MKGPAPAPIRFTPRGITLGRVLGVAVCFVSAWVVLEVVAWICVALTGGAG
jgi:hypothetical protein